MTKKMNIPFSPPDISEKEIEAVSEALRSGWITTGPRTKELERQMAEFTGTKRGACLNSATACMETALRLFGIGAGDEVIVPAYTYTASASVVCHVGATLKLIDVQEGTYHLDYDELEALIVSMGEPKYRAGQIFTQLARGKAPDAMPGVPKALAARLCDAAPYHLPHIERRQVSAVDGTEKFLFGLADGACVETVLMRYHHGNTVCVSSQVGCRMGCAFCASTIGGRVRNLTAGEILGQVIAVGAASGERVGNIVMMGIGEPLDNYENVTRFLHLVNDRRGLDIGYRHISLSTCGLADGIRRLAGEELPITLSISLHAPDDETRSAIMPVNRRYPIAELMAACRCYYRTTERRISFEYTLIKGKNSSPADARRLAELLNRSLRQDGLNMPIHVNLIPVNPVRETGLMPPERGEIARFASVLEERGIRATVRRRLGPDIDAACGQLRRAAAKQAGESAE